MASTGSNTNLAKKRHSFLSHFLSTKNLSIFRSKSPTNNLSNDAKHYQSHIDIPSEQTSIPLCISRGWLKRHSQRPISLDLDLINNNGNFIEQHQFDPKHVGTIRD
jgi:hypothetical protein